MKNRLLISMLTFFALSSTELLGQVVIYNEDFDGALTWTINTDLTAEGANPNQWYISCEEEGVGAGLCGTACGAGDNTLHVGANVLVGDLGAAYFETGAGLTTTNRRAESANINTIGHTDLTLRFDMIGKGGGTDFTEVFYSIDGGGTWVSIASPLTTLCCGGVPCTGVEQGLWIEQTYALPAVCEGIPNLRISFVWKNVDDGVATDPSFAVDNITIEKPVVVVVGGPTALFTPEASTVCQGSTIVYTDASLTTDVISDWNWTFGGGTPGSALTVGPHAVTYNTPGVFTTTLVVTDGIGSHDTSFTVTVLDGPFSGASVSADLCEGDVLDLNTLIPTADPGGTWSETSGAPSGTFTPGTGELDGTGLTVGDVFTFEYLTEELVGPCAGTDVSVITITIIECGPLFASFVPSNTTVCKDECLTFVNNSTGTGIIGHVWSFSDVAIGGPIPGADPGTVCFPTVGDVDVTLTITDGVLFDDTTITITVAPLPVVNATASATTICVDGSVTLTGTGDALGYTWSGGVVDGVAFTLATTTTFTVTGVNAFGCITTDDITITVIDCEPLIAGFSFDDLVCQGQCITLTDTSLGDPVEWLWDFGGGATPATSTDENPLVCFDTPGIFDIQLTVTNALGESASTTNSITVFATPTVDAERDTIIDLGGVANLLATASVPGGSYTWSPDDFIECDNCPNTTSNSPEEIVYIVTFVDVNGCSATDSVRVFVNFIEAIGVADAFTPNGDGVNDVLNVMGFGLEAITFSIFNKYGEKVFESQTQLIGWDGTFRGRDQNPGVFTWVLEYQFVNGKTGVMNGTTTLVR